MVERALNVVDIQNDYFPGGKWTLSGMDAAADNAARLIAAARADGDLLIHILHQFLSDEAPFFTPGSPGAQIHQKARNRVGELVVLKHQVNAFRDTDLKETLDRNGVKKVTICGAMSHMCVDAATRAASDFGYEVTVVHDACASRDLEFNGVVVPAAQAHAAYMSSLGFAYATLLSTGDYLDAKTAEPKVA